MCRRCHHAMSTTPLWAPAVPAPPFRSSVSPLIPPMPVSALLPSVTPVMPAVMVPIHVPVPFRVARRAHAHLPVPSMRSVVHWAPLSPAIVSPVFPAPMVRVIARGALVPGCCNGPVNPRRRRLAVVSLPLPAVDWLCTFWGLLLQGRRVMPSPLQSICSCILAPNSCSLVT